MPATIKDVAKEAGFSPTTICRVLRNVPNVHEKTRLRVWEVIKELNYEPNEVARQLVKQRYSIGEQRTENIGLVFFKKSKGKLFSNPFYHDVFEGMVTEAEAHNNNLIFSIAKEDIMHALDFPLMLKKRSIDGLVLMGDMDEESITILKDEEPLILVGKYVKGENVNCVIPDNISGTHKIIDYLVKLGHKDIGFISEPLKHTGYEERFNGFKAALDEYGLEYHDEFVRLDADEDGYLATKEMLERFKIPSAIVGVHDSLAIGIMKAIKGKGLRIPEDISVVGFDDLDIAEESEPPLTTIRVFKKEMGATAIRRLLEVIHNKTKIPEKTVIAVELIERKSCERCSGR